MVCLSVCKADSSPVRSQKQFLSSLQRGLGFITVLVSIWGCEEGSFCQGPGSQLFPGQGMPLQNFTWLGDAHCSPRAKDAAGFEAGGTQCSLENAHPGEAVPCNQHLVVGLLSWHGNETECSALVPAGRCWGCQWWLGPQKASKNPVWVVVIQMPHFSA